MMPNLSRLQQKLLPPDAYDNATVICGFAASHDDLVGHAVVAHRLG
jgi:hypothetical protein